MTQEKRKLRHSDQHLELPHEVIKTLAGDEFSCIVKKNKVLKIPLMPSCLNDVAKVIQFMIEKEWIGSYNKE